MAQVNKKNFKKAKNRKNKTLLVFNEEKRREFLSGFHKRKLQRKKHAQEKLAQELKEERKRLKHEARESYKELVVSRRPVPELDDLLAEEYEDDDVTVKVTELSTSQIAQQNNWIGENRPQYEVADDQEEQSEDEQPNENNIPGMELKEKPKTKVKKDLPELKTKKDIKRVLKKKATKNVQKSKAFQLKNKLEQQKNRKKSLQQKKERIKLRTQNNKKRGKNNH